MKAKLNIGTSGDYEILLTSFEIASLLAGREIKGSLEFFKKGTAETHTVELQIRTQNEMRKLRREKREDFDSLQYSMHVVVARKGNHHSVFVEEDEADWSGMLENDPLHFWQEKRYDDLTGKKIFFRKDDG